MTAEEIGLMRYLLDCLEFRELPELVGQRFSAGHPGEILDSGELLELVGLGGAIENDATNLERTLIGYGFVDLKFRLTRWPAELQESGARVVRALLGDPSFSRTTEPEYLARDRLGCLDDICAQVDSGIRQLTVMATARGLPDLDVRKRFRINTGREQRGFALFPREFEITDAYVTNAPAVSLNRHFYV